MKIIIKTTNIDLTPSFKAYIEKKLSYVPRLLKRLDEKDAAEMRVEAARITRHHKSGDVFRAEINLDLPGRVLRAEARAGDAREAIDLVKNILWMEIVKYKTRFSAKRRAK